MKYCIIISLIFMALGLRGQDYVGIDFIEFEIEDSRWETDFHSLDSLFWENGKLKTLRIEEKGIKYNCQYDSQGRQIMKYAVIAQTVIDTVFTEDPDTGEGWHGVISTYYVDIPHGKFESKMSFNSYGGDDGHDLINGQYYMGTKGGVWTLRKPIAYILISVQLNEKGQPAGAYSEVYIKSGKPKWTGQYKIAQFDQNYYDFDTGEEFGVLMEGSIKTGVWKRYSNWENGAQSDEIEFKHY